MGVHSAYTAPFIKPSRNLDCQTFAVNYVKSMHVLEDLLHMMGCGNRKTSSGNTGAWILTAYHYS